MNTFIKFILKKEQYTVDDAIEHFGFGTFQAKIAMITGLVFMSDALEMMVCLIEFKLCVGFGGIEEYTM